METSKHQRTTQFYGTVTPHAISLRRMAASEAANGVNGSRYSSYPDPDLQATSPLSSACIIQVPGAIGC